MKIKTRKDLVRILTEGWKNEVSVNINEITFLTNYLTLEQTSRPQFYYEFTSEGEVNRMLVPPLLFIPFVQYIVKAIDEQQIQPPVSLKTHLKAEKGTIIFACACPEVNLLSSDKGLERIRQRL